MKLERAVLGHRLWRVFSGYPDRLWPAATPVGWEPGINVAVCAYPHASYNRSATEIEKGVALHPRRYQNWHDAPASGCHCGFWGIFDRPLLIQAKASYLALPRFSTSPPSAALVEGIIVQWGKLCVHRTGIRSEFAEIISIIGTELNGDSREAIGKRYNIPIASSHEELVQYAGEWDAAPRVPEEDYERIRRPVGWNG